MTSNKFSELCDYNNYYVLIILIIITKICNNYYIVGVMKLYLLNLLILIVFCVILTLVCSLRACHMWLTRNHMFIREIWQRFQNFKKVNLVNLSQISLLNMWLLVLVKVDIRMFLEWENNSGKLQITSGKFQNSRKFQNNAINDIKQISLSHAIINEKFAQAFLFVVFC